MINNNCDNNSPACTEGEIRLADGASSREGRVEICKNSTWGTVCHSQWNHLDAKVVCRQLGLSEAGKGYNP